MSLFGPVCSVLLLPPGPLLGTKPSGFCRAQVQSLKKNLERETLAKEMEREKGIARAVPYEAEAADLRCGWGSGHGKRRPGRGDGGGCGGTSSGKRAMQFRPLSQLPLGCWGTKQPPCARAFCGWGANGGCTGSCFLCRAKVEQLQTELDRERRGKEIEREQAMAKTIPNEAEAAELKYGSDFQAMLPPPLRHSFRSCCSVPLLAALFWRSHC